MRLLLLTCDGLSGGIGNLADGGTQRRLRAHRDARVDHDGRAQLSCVQRRGAQIEGRRHREHSCARLSRQHEHERRLIDAAQHRIQLRARFELVGPLAHEPNSLAANCDHAGVELPATPRRVGRRRQRRPVAITPAAVLPPVRVSLHHAHHVIVVGERCEEREQRPRPEHEGVEVEQQHPGRQEATLPAFEKRKDLYAAKRAPRRQRQIVDAHDVEADDAGKVGERCGRWTVGHEHSWQHAVEAAGGT